VSRKRRPSFVIFDLGNVLVHIEPAAFLRSLSIDTHDNRNYYQSKVVDIVKSYERGDDSTEVFFAKLDTLFNERDSMLQHHHGGKNHFTLSDFRNATLSIIGVPVEGMEEIVHRVGASAHLGLLSNTNPIHFDYCLQTFRVLRFIPTHFLSYQLKAFKPEPEIFTQVIERVSLPPEEIFYIDDLVENVEAARSVGLLAHQFVGLKDTEKLLTDLNLI
jgi:putative hydrolase of the HAD superfamily